MNEKIMYLIGINSISFLLMGIDKYKAIKNKWRIQENTFLILALFGGFIGILLGMILFHHKTQKLKFKLLIPLTMLINFYIFFKK
jgi:uncharacterized membrane protein YsdA (DUF1294 family)